MQEEEDLILGEDVLEDALERMDANLRLEPTVERALQLMALDFAEEVVTGAAQLAKHREAKQVRHGGFFLVALPSRRLMRSAGVSERYGLASADAVGHSHSRLSLGDA
jgi:histone H3/H4